ncbi:MAG: TIGR03668 family PPOX class F420-dependent oxidoreductase [Nitriliruptorales bacterium]
MDEGKIRTLFQAARVASLATVRPDGRPHLVPVTFAVDGDRIVTAVDHKPKRTTSLQRLENIRSNPAVSLLAHRYDADWTRLWWARVDGEAQVVEEGTDHKAAVELLVGKYRQYRARPPEGPAILVDATGWRGWSA